MDLIYHRATTEDLEVLTRTRAVVLQEANGLPEDADMSRVETGAREYYRRALADGSHVAYLVYDGETLVGARRCQLLSGNAYLSKPDREESVHHEHDTRRHPTADGASPGAPWIFWWARPAGPAPPSPWRLRPWDGPCTRNTAL